MSDFASLPASARSLSHEGLRVPFYAALALMLALALQLLLPDSPPPETPARIPRIAVPPSADIAVNDHIVLEAPIFAPDRQPDPNDRIGPAPAGDLVLLALAQAQTTSVALIRGGDGEVHRVVQGEDIDGWRFVSIEQGRVVLERGGLRKSLAVVPGQAVPVAAPAPSPAEATTQDEDASDQ